MYEFEIRNGISRMDFHIILRNGYEITRYMRDEKIRNMPVAHKQIKEKARSPVIRIPEGGFPGNAVQTP